MKRLVIDALIFIAILLCSALILKIKGQYNMGKTATNPITGDKIQTKTSSKKYYDNYDSIFRKDKELKNNETPTSTTNTPSNQ